jgi:hypothetical protein
MLAFTMLIPALMANSSSMPAAPPQDNFIKLAASGTSLIRDYAIITAAQWEATRTSVAWRDFGAANVMLTGEVDISRIVNVNSPSYLVVALKPDTRVNKTMASLSSLAEGTDFIRYNLLIPAARPSIVRPTFFDDPVTGAPNAKYRLVTGLEYQKLGDRSWADVPHPEWNIELNEYRVEYFVRTKATSERAASQTVRLTVPALAAPPTARLDVIRGEIRARSGWIVKTDNPASGTGTSLSSARTFTVNNIEENLAADRIGRTSKEFMFRVPSTERRAGSTWTTLYIGFGSSENLDGDRVNDYFALTARNILIVGGIPVQANVGGRWRTVKNIRFSDFTPATGIGTIDVRMAGTRTKLPGEQRTLWFDRATGELSFTPIIIGD